MSKIFANYKISKNDITLSILKDSEKNYIRVNEDLIYEYSSFSEIFNLFTKDFHEFSLKFKKHDIYLNIIFEDNLFSKISTKIQELQVFDFLEESKNDKKQSFKINSNESFTLNEKIFQYTTHKNNLYKKYKNYPRDKEFDELFKTCSTLTVETENIEFKTFIKDIYDILNKKHATLFKNVVLSLKSQNLANKLIEEKEEQFLLNVQDEFISISSVINGTIVEYNRILVGTNILFKNLSSLYSLDVLKSRMKFIINSILDSREFYNDKINIALLNNLNHFCNSIYQKIVIRAYEQKKHQNINLNKIWVYTENGLYNHFIINDLNKLSKNLSAINGSSFVNLNSNNENKVKFLDLSNIKHVEFGLVPNLDAIIKQSILNSNDFVNDDIQFIQTITKEINFTKNNKSNLFRRFTNIFKF